MRLRIVSGELGGRFIEAPPGRTTRPTSSRVREAWFSALGDRVADARVLDLFAGSGALGLEALSRGAAHAHFVESDRRVLVTLRRNVEALGVEDRATLVPRDVFEYLEGVDDAEEPFDLALADPPYATQATERLLERFAEGPFASLLCVEGTADGPAPRGRAEWTRRYGDTRLTFYSPESIRESEP